MGSMVISTQDTTFGWFGHEAHSPVLARCLRYNINVADSGFAVEEYIPFTNVEPLKSPERAAVTTKTQTVKTSTLGVVEVVIIGFCFFLARSDRRFQRFNVGVTKGTYSSMP